MVDAAASALSSKRSDIIALVYPSTAEPLATHDAAFIGAVEHHVRAAERHLMIWATEDAVKTADKLRSWRVDGAIFYGTLGSEVDDLDRRLHIPLVFVDNYSDSPRVNRVGIDDYQGGRLAAEHLIEAGHRTLGFVGPLRHDVGVVRERYRGFQAAIGAADERVDELRVECDPTFPRDERRRV